MTAKKISELTAASTPLAGTESLPVVQSGTTKKATAQDIANLVSLSGYATQSYVDAAIAGLSWKQAVRVATTAAGTLASSFENGDTVDGVTLATGDRILIKNQASGAENGIYTVAASGAPSRASDANSSAELVNASVYVSEGTTNADTQWTCTTNAPITVDSTSIAFAQLSSGGGTLSGPGSSTDNALVRWDGTGGTAVQSSPVVVSDTGEISGYSATLNTQTGTTYTVASTDAGKVIDHANASAIAVTLPADAAVGFCCTYVQAGAGQITFSADTGATLRNRQAHSKSAGQYAMMTLYVRSNSGGSAAEWVLGGDTSI